MANSRKKDKAFIDTHIGRRYTVTVKHDNGIANITTFAANIVEAIDIICRAERCPLRSVIAAKVVK